MAFQILCQFGTNSVTSMFVGHLGDMEHSFYCYLSHFHLFRIHVDGLFFSMNVIGWEAMIFIGINAATSIRVSNELGLGHPQPQAAKYSVYITVFQSLLISILCMIIILAASNHFSIIFTSSKCMQRGCFPPFWPSWNDYGSVLKPVISGTLWWHDSRNSFADIAILVSSLQN
ncbi:protein DETOXIFICATION 21-like [Olea europaea var. sylvestris]|uniref:protein DETOXIFICATION 21-like n=1 Tax=Olea europaea var. sylvestris TaxID=158386 RepID=UPI000C1CF93D|nr:protein DETOXIFICATION 21-like [Olea europaea var. sylvestris]